MLAWVIVQWVFRYWRYGCQADQAPVESLSSEVRNENILLGCDERLLPDGENSLWGIHLLYSRKALDVCHTQAKPINERFQAAQERGNNTKRLGGINGIHYRELSVVAKPCRTVELGSCELKNDSCITGWYWCILGLLILVSRYGDMSTFIFPAIRKCPGTHRNLIILSAFKPFVISWEMVGTKNEFWSSVFTSCRDISNTHQSIYTKPL